LLARRGRRPPSRAKAGAGGGGARTPLLVLVLSASAGGAYAPPIAAGSHLSLPDVVKHMFQVFSDVSRYVASVHIDVAKINRDDSYVAMVVDVCCKLLFSMFHMFFSDVYCNCVYLDITYFSYIFCKVFYLDVAYVCNSFKCF
jgi:hypothetical protein